MNVIDTTPAANAARTVRIAAAYKARQIRAEMSAYLARSLQEQYAAADRRALVQQIEADQRNQWSAT